MVTNEIPNHFTLIVFWCERRDLLSSHSKGDIFTCEDNMLFSHVKIPSFRAKAHLVFHWCLYNKIKYVPVATNSMIYDGLKLQQQEVNRRCNSKIPMETWPSSSILETGF